MKSKRKQVENESNSFGYYFGLFFLLAVPAYFIYKIGTGYYKSQRLDSGTTAIIAARVTSDRHFFGNSPVTQQYSYGYEFKIEDKQYKGNTRDPDMRPGDSIKVKYVKDNPEINSPMK